MSVSDTGVGIPHEQLAHIWSEFHQGQTHGGRRGGGFGLGLAIVRQYTTMLGGGYGAESQEGHGARVWVSLPPGPSRASVVEAEAPDELGRATKQE
jgi:signal transduction histidine kinase